LYGMDPWDSSLYDVVLNIKKLTVDTAVDILCETAKRRELQTTPESQRAMDDLVLASEVHIAVTEQGIEAESRARDGVVTVTTKAPRSQEEGIAEQIRTICQRVGGVTDVRVEVIPQDLFE